MFNQEFEFFINNQERLVQQYGGKVLAIKKDEIIAVYETPAEAYQKIKQDGELGKVMIQPCLAGKDAYTVSIASVGVVR
jgi:Family of unknown function (DUF5678)